LLKAYQKAFLKCNAIVSTSQKQLDFLTTNFLIKAKCHVVRTGVDIDNIQPLAKNRDIVLFPRNMQPLYNHELAIKALLNLPKKCIETHEFVFVNKNSSNLAYVSKIKTLIENTKLKNIRFIDSLKGIDYYNMLAQSKLVVMTPSSDGAPVSAMETIATGVPIVLPDLDYDTDLFNTAYFYEKNNELALTNAILKGLKTTTSIVNLQNYKTKIDRKIEMKKIEVVYHEILSKGNEK